MDGERHCTHGLLMASVSDSLKNLMLDLSCPSDQVVILLPDTSGEEVEEGMQAVMGKKEGRGRNSFMVMMGIKLGIPENKSILSGMSTKNSIDIYVNDIPKEVDTNNKKDLDGEDTRCTFCGETFISVKRMICHVSISHDQESKNAQDEKEKNIIQYNCRFCESSFSKTSTYNKHMTKKHSTETTRMCEECNKYFVNINSFTKHMQTQHPTTQTRTCEVCQKLFSNTSQRLLKKSLVDHMITEHSTVPFFDCDICQQSFVKESSLYSHKISHNRSFICHICAKDFCSQPQLDRHSLKIHGTEEEKNRAKKYICNICSFRCYTNCGLNAHVQMHSETYDFQCDQCDYKSKTKQALNIHVRRRHLGKLETQEQKKIWNARKRQKKQKKKMDNGGLYRTGKEREEYNRYMREFQYKERFICELCKKETINPDWHKKFICIKLK